MKTNFDYIVIGAGSAGCVLAARLTEDADVTVALVEAGDSDNAPEIDDSPKRRRQMTPAWIVEVVAGVLGAPVF